MSFILLFFAIYSCSLLQTDTLLENAIKSTFSTCTNKKACEINLSQALEFDWDSMYVFGINATPKYITEITGIEYSKSKDLTRVIIFTWEGKITYEERNEFNPELPYRYRFLGEQKKFSSNSSRFLINSTGKVFELSILP